MKKKLAQEINKTNKKINEQIETTHANMGDVGHKILKDDNLTLKDIQQLGECLAEKQGYDKNQLIICNITDLNSCLMLHKNDDINQKPLFIICYNEQNTRAVFSIVKLLDKTFCLYKDFSNIQIPENIKNIIEQNFGKNIEFKIHTEIGKIENQKDNDLLSLKALEIMMNYLKPDKMKDFIEGFANPKKTFFGWLKDGVNSVKNELFSLVKEGYDKVCDSDLDQLSKDTEFKAAIKKFINSIPLEEVDNFKNYQNLLKKFVELEESEVDTDTIKIKELERQLNEARENAFSKTKELKIYTETGDQQLDIVKKFPTQMEKFTRIFELLTQSEIDKKLGNRLEKISSKLDIEYEKLKSFFKSQEKTKTDNKENTYSVQDIKELITTLPNPNKDTNPSSIDTHRPFEQLLSEVVVEKIDSLKEGYNKVQDFYKLWEDKDALAINEWAVSKKKEQLTDSEIYEALAIMDRANELVTGGHKLRDTQILSVLTFLQQKDKGQLSQIQTGEGKTTIVSIVAAIKALQGETVDVITSNSVLASDGVKYKENFYNLLSLSVTTNNLDENYKSGERECYKADIVYGCIGNFQFDYLKDSFLGLKTRADRPFESIVLDEVDSMIIDNASHIAKLSEQLPGMESLKYVYIKIWQELYKAEEAIIQEFQEKLKEKAKELQSQTLSDNEAQTLYKAYEDELKDSVIQKIKDYIKSANPTKIDIIPSHIQEYADNSLDKWINSAIDAKFHYHEDEQYVIRINKNGEQVVQPIDYTNTGITLKNTIWQYGLHQFLQLKHNLHLTSESLTSCFISNLSYINKYGNKIFGLTGTLGLHAEQELLSSIYNVGYAKIPTYKEKKFSEIDGEVVDDEIFGEKVADEAIYQANKGRSSLIICETIKDVKTIQEALKRQNKDIIIKTFFDEENAHITEEAIKPGEVVIATNIAGRGTDLQTTYELEQNGGLHVCVAFLPCNKRVEDQAFGRTARQGNEGTAKLVLKKSEAKKLGIDSYSFEDIKLIRDLKEEERIKHIKEVKILELNFQDRLFGLFSTLYRKLQKEYQSKGEYKYVLDDLKEFWAFWLEKKNFRGLELANKSVEEEFKEFKSEADETIRGVIKFNSYYSIKQAEHFILNEKLDEAEKALNHAIAISKNPEILHSAYIKFFEIAIEKGRVFIDKCKKAIGYLLPIQAIEPDREYKENAKKYLEQAKKAFQKELDYIESLFGAEEFTNIIKSNSSTEVNKKDCSYWFSDSDMHEVGKKVLSTLGINIDLQFRNRVTKDLIKTFCEDYIPTLKDQLPVFICYNIGGQTDQTGGIHWVGMCVVKIQDRIKIFYKDPKGDFGGNINVVEQEFKKYCVNLDFIAHPMSEQTDDSSCGPMTLENLRIMAKSIQQDGIVKFIENFTALNFSRQQDVQVLRDEFISDLPNETQKRENLFIKHIISKQQALNLNMNHADSLIQQIDKHEGGISISGRISDYFSNLKPQNDNEKKIKDTITNSELSELSAIGTNTTYVLREVHDICPEIATGVQVQIGGGIALIATGFCFPPALPVASAIGGTMITEGICDVAIELINKNSDGQFNKDAYIKGKVISYGVSLVTMGISAAMQCPKILNAAKKACRWVSETLRKCPFLESVCEILATKFDKIGDWFEKMETIAKFSYMSKAEKLKYVDDLRKSKDLQQLKYLGENIKQISELSKELQEVGKLTELTHFEKCISTMKQVAMITTKNVATRTVESVIMSKAVTPALNLLMLELKPTIRKHVDKSIRENINQERLKSSSYEEIQNIIKEIRESIDYETIKDIFKDAILGITKYCSNWRVQLCALAFDQYDSWQKVYNYAKNLCEKINGRLKSTGKSINHNIDELINQLIEQFSEEMYSQFVSTTIKTCKDVYSVGRSAYENYKHEKKEEAKCLEINKAFKAGGLAGQEQAKALSDVIKRPIHIYEENGNIIIIGKQYLGDPIKVSYFPPDENNPTGHYVPYDKNENWSSGNGKNNCLFDAVGLQIGKDSMQLRQESINKIESDPTRYIASNVREVCGSGALLEGGRRNQSIESNNYPSHQNKIKVVEKHKKVLAKLRNDFNEHKNEVDKFTGKKETEKLTYMKHNKSIQHFGSNPKKEEMMMGVLEVTFTNGTKFQIATVSGDEPFSVRSSVSDNNNLSYKLTPIPFVNEYDGFTFIDPGKPKGKIYDVYNRQATNIEYNKGCAAQKLMYKLGEHMKANPKLTIKDDIYMSEAWYKPGTDNFSAKQVVIEKSCSYCEQVLPITTGSNFTGHGFDNYESSNYWNQYSKHAMEVLLKLRLESINAQEITVITPNRVYDGTLLGTRQLINEILEVKQDVILVPLNLYGKHWVGLMIQKDQDKINIIYMDSEQNTIPSSLKEQLIKQTEAHHPRHNVTISESKLDSQKYNNCGPEVIENFINCLVGDRLSQEDTVTVHSMLFEDTLLLGVLL